MLGATDGRLVLVDATTGAPAASLSPAANGAAPEARDGVDALGFAADGTTLAVGFASPRTVLVDGHTLAVRATLEGRLAGRLADGRVLTLPPDGRVLVHPRAGGAPAVLAGGNRPILAVAVSADQAQLATADQAGVVRLWDLATLAPRLAFSPAELDQPTALAFVDGDRALAIGGSAGALRLVPLAPARAVAHGCALLAYFDRAAEVAEVCPAPPPSSAATVAAPIQTFSRAPR